MASAGTLWVNIAANTTRLTKGLGQARAAVNRWGGTVAAAGATAVVALGRTFEGINQSMTRSLAIMGDVSDVMRNRMTQAAVEVSKTTQFSTKQAAEAYFFLASAGLDAQQSLAAMPQVAKFAQAGNFNLALATDLVTDAQSSLGLASKDAALNLGNMKRVTDVLVKANTLANASVEQFSTSLTTKAGAALKVVGKDVEEGVAVLAALADQGVKGSDAGTALSIVFRDLQTKALQNADAFKAQKVAVFDAQGEMRNMADVVGDLEKSLAGMSDAQKKATLLQLGFSDKSVSFIQVLLGTSEKIRGYETALRDAAGTTDEVANKSLTKMQQAINSLRGSWEELSTVVGPFLVDTAANFANWISGMSAAGEGASRLTMAFATIADVAHTIRLGFLKVQEVYTGVLGFIVDKIATVVSFAIRQINRLPGVDIQDQTFISTLAEELDRSADQIGQKFNKLFVAATPSEKIKKFFEDVREEADKAAAATASAAAQSVLPANAHSFLQKIGSAITSGAGAATSGFATGVKSAAAAVVGGKDIGLPPALALTKAGSVESYRQRAAISKQNEGTKIAKQHFQETKKSNDLLGKIHGALAGTSLPSIFGEG